MDDGRRNTRIVEGGSDIFGMGNGGTEDDGGPLARLFLSVPDDLVSHRRAVHDLRDLGHVVVGGCLAHGAQLFLDADVDDESARRHQMARRDQLAQATSNSKEQFSNSPALSNAILNAIIDALDAHTVLSRQALDSLPVREGLKEILLGPGRLYEALRSQA